MLSGDEEAKRVVAAKDAELETQEQRLRELAQKCAALEGSVAGGDEKVQQLVAAKAELQAQHERLLAQNAELDGKAQSQAKEAADLKGRAAQMERKEQELQAQIEMLSMSEASMRATTERIDEERSVLEEKVKALESELTVASDALSGATEDALQESNKEISALKESLAHAQAEEQRVQELTQKCAALEVSSCGFFWRQGGLLGHRRLKKVGSMGEGPLRFLVQNLKDDEYDREDDVVKATSMEDHLHHHQGPAPAEPAAQGADAVLRSGGKQGPRA